MEEVSQPDEMMAVKDSTPASSRKLNRPEAFRPVFALSAPLLLEFLS